MLHVQYRLIPETTLVGIWFISFRYLPLSPWSPDQIKDKKLENFTQKNFKPHRVWSTLIIWSTFLKSHHVGTDESFKRLHFIQVYTTNKTHDSVLETMLVPASRPTVNVSRCSVPFQVHTSSTENQREPVQWVKVREMCGPWKRYAHPASGRRDAPLFPGMSHILSEAR